MPLLPLSTTSTHAETPIPYTGSPLLLCLADIRLFISLIWAIPGILHPITRFKSGALDELYPSIPNIISLALHTFLLVFQSLFLLTLPLLVLLPLWTAGFYLLGVGAVTWFVALMLNGGEDVLYSTVDLGPDAAQHEDECWMFLNGVSVGKHWLQSNLNRLSYTFRRPITGVHNRTYGIVFDLLQCIVERDFLYATTDVRREYVTIKGKLLEEKNKKVVLMLHSQGGIEGGMILDWLLTELPHDVVNKLEIYTFGSAANHFNNPPRYADSQTAQCNPHAVRHIEHYASSVDFVARWGVLHFASLPNRYAGRVFVRPGTGHLLNQHYLDAMFPLDENMRVKEHNSFMDMRVTFIVEGADGKGRERNLETVVGKGDEMDDAVVEDDQEDVSPSTRHWPETSTQQFPMKPKVREFSRLWLYRNGGSPKD